MSWTYASSNAGSSDLSWVRMRVGDCTSGDQLLQDEEIEAALSEMGSKYFAAARSARAISAWFARRVQKSVGKLSLSAQQASESYERLAVQLEMEGGIGTAPYAGGISISDKESVANDSDRVLPQFVLGQTDIPGTGVAGTTDGEMTGW